MIVAMFLVNSSVASRVGEALAVSGIISSVAPVDKARNI